MPVSLGASLSDPHFVAVQILHTLSVFFILLGVVRVVLGVLVLALFHSRNDSNSLWVSLSFCFHIPLRSLFAVRVLDGAGGTDGSAVRFFFMHVFTAICMSYPLALTIQRRKFALDFTITLYAIYFFLCCLVERRFLGGGPAWWLAVQSGFCIMYTATVVLCRHRELQDIFFPALSPVASPVHFGGSDGTLTTTSTTAAAATTTAPGALNARLDPVTMDAGERLFTADCTSPSHGVDAVLMGPGSASKRR